MHTHAISSLPIRPPRASLLACISFTYLDESPESGEARARKFPCHSCFADPSEPLLLSSFSAASDEKLSSRQLWSLHSLTLLLLLHLCSLHSHWCGIREIRHLGLPDSISAIRSKTIGAKTQLEQSVSFSDESFQSCSRSQASRGLEDAPMMANPVWDRKTSSATSHFKFPVSSASLLSSCPFSSL